MVKIVDLKEYKNTLHDPKIATTGSELVSLVRKKYLNYISMNPDDPPVYRGISGDKDFYIVDPTKNIRLSQNTSNEYTWLLSSLENWKMFPPRTRSLICTSTLYHSQYYGNPYVVITPNKCDIGVCSEPDIWGSFPMIKSLGIKSMSQFNFCLNHLLMSVLGLHYSDSNSMEFFSALNQANIKLENNQENYYGIDDNADRLLGRYMEYKKQKQNLTFKEFLSIILDPFNNEFDLVTTETLDYVRDEKEIWMSGVCILVKADKYREFASLVLNTEEKINNV